MKNLGTGSNQAGLHRVFRDWGGLGSLIDSLMSQDSSRADRDLREWSEQDLRARAIQVILLRNRCHIFELPTEIQEWFNQLPRETERETYWSTSPQGRVDWRRTALRGWPPEKFRVKERSRNRDSLLPSIISWTAAQLVEFRALEKQDPRLSLPTNLSNRVDTMIEVGGLLGRVDETLPSESELRTVRNLGGIWAPLSIIAEEISSLDTDGAIKYADALIRPDIEDRFFQLNVLGHTLLALENVLSAKASSLRPISGGNSPVYKIGDFYVWWEAAGIWDHLGVRNVRKSMAHRALVNYNSRSDRPDIVLTNKDHILILECKYSQSSSDPGYISSGISQSFFYVAQLSHLFKSSTALTVGPSDLVTSLGDDFIGGVRVGLSSANNIDHFIKSMSPTAHSEDQH